jgi:hypothetical protein
MWAIDRAKKFAFQALEHAVMPSVDKIELAIRCCVPTWLEPAYVDLCTREDPLTLEEASRLQLDKYFALTQIRERLSRDRRFDVVSAVRHSRELQTGKHSSFM